MSRPLCAALVLILSGVCIASSQSQNNHVYKSRIGDIVIMHAQPVKGDGVLIAIDNMSEDLAASSRQFSAEDTLRETDIAPLISHVIGSIPMSAEIPKQVEAFGSISVMHKPRANLLINIPDLGHYSAQELAMSQIQAMRENHPSFTVASTFEPRNPLAQLTTIATGEQPSVHGVIGSEWINAAKNRVVAFNKDEAFSHAVVPTVADLVAHSFDGSLIVSVSASSQFAAAAAPHPSSLAKASIISVNSQTKTVEVVGASEESRPVSSQTVLDLFKSNAILGRFVEQGGVVSLDGSKLMVQPFHDATAADSVSFDLTQDADFSFFGEMAAVQQLIASLESNTHVSDANPDLYTLTLSGLSSLINSYGMLDGRTKAAAQLLDSSVPQILRAFTKLYTNDVAAEVVLMGSHSDSDSAVKKSVMDTLEGSRSINPESTFPHIYVEESIPHAELKALCSRVNAAVAQHGMKAECMNEFTRPIFLQQKAASSKSYSGSSTVTRSDIVNYHINLWVSVILILALLGGLYPLMYMDVTKGTYSSFLFAKKYV